MISRIPGDYIMGVAAPWMRAKLYSSNPGLPSPSPSPCPTGVQFDKLGSIGFNNLIIN